MLRPSARAGLRSVLPLFPLLLGVALAGASCDSGPAPGGPIPIAQFRVEMETAQCDYAVRCGLMPDADTCHQTTALARDYLQALADVGFGLTKYDETRARSCVEAVRAAFCVDAIAEAKKLADACRGAFTGVGTDGSACFVGSACSSGYCDFAACTGGGSCCAGTCAPDPGYAKDGEDCTTRPCDEDLYCVPDGSGNPTVCAPSFGNGQDCMLDVECGEYQNCDNSGFTCYLLAGPGQQCNPLLAFGACQAFNEDCDADTKKCSPAPGPGEPCGVQYRCQGYTLCNGATCEPLPVEGEACDGNNPCLGQLVCDNGTCVKPPAPTVCAFGLP